MAGMGAARMICWCLWKCQGQQGCSAEGGAASLPPILALGQSQAQAQKQESRYRLGIQDGSCGVNGAAWAPRAVLGADGDGLESSRSGAESLFRGSDVGFGPPRVNGDSPGRGNDMEKEELAGRQCASGGSVARMLSALAESYG